MLVFANSKFQIDKRAYPTGAHTMFESRRRVFLRHFGVFLLIMFFLYVLSCLTRLPSKRSQRNTTTTSTEKTGKPETSGPKFVLLWNWVDGNITKVMDLTSWSLEEDTLPECPFKCNFVMNISNISMVDAVVFNANVMDTDYVVPSRDYFDQIWTIFRTEPPVSFTVPSDLFYFYDNINWTMTYRRDSDVPWRAGQLVPSDRVQNETFPTTVIKSRKSKSLIAWLNSDCKTSNYRDLYVKNLTKFIPVDNYGLCKPQKMLCNRNTTNCHEKLAKKYKFWLVYESAFCVDYLTEEYYKALEYGMVPILFAHEKATELILKGTYINGRDFKTPEELAKYIRHLDENPKEYFKYFEWRKKFQVVGKQELARKTWCNFCTKLYNVDLKGGQKFYRNLNDWFTKNYTSQRQCQIPIFTESSGLFFSLFKFQ